MAEAGAPTNLQGPLAEDDQLEHAIQDPIHDDDWLEFAPGSWKQCDSYIVSHWGDQAKLPEHAKYGWHKAVWHPTEHHFVDAFYVPTPSHDSWAAECGGDHAASVPIDFEWHDRNFEDDCRRAAQCQIEPMKNDVGSQKVQNQNVLPYKWQPTEEDGIVGLKLRAMMDRKMNARPSERRARLLH